MKQLNCLIILMMLLAALTGCVPHSTGETEVGVRTVKFDFFGRKGVEEKVYAPGSTYFFMPFINDWHTFDTKLQNLEMTHDRSRGDRKSRDDLLFKTIDGNDISLDVIIAYRIDPQKAPSRKRPTSFSSWRMTTPNCGTNWSGPSPAANPGTSSAN